MIDITKRYYIKIPKEVPDNVVKRFTSLLANFVPVDGLMVPDSFPRGTIGKCETMIFVREEN